MRWGEIAATMASIWALRGAVSALFEPDAAKQQNSARYTRSGMLVRVRLRSVTGELVARGSPGKLGRGLISELENKTLIRLTLFCVLPSPRRSDQVPQALTRAEGGL